jgi:hypothetical protein
MQERHYLRDNMSDLKKRGSDKRPHYLFRLVGVIFDVSSFFGMISQLAREPLLESLFLLKVNIMNDNKQLPTSS